MSRLESRVRYDSYIRRSEKELARRSEFEQLSLSGVDYSAVPSLSNEGRERLLTLRPASLGAAGRLRGLRDSDITALLVHVRTARQSGP